VHPQRALQPRLLSGSAADGARDALNGAMPGIPGMPGMPGIPARTTDAGRGGEGRTRVPTARRALRQADSAERTTIDWGNDERADDVDGQEASWSGWDEEAGDESSRSERPAGVWRCFDFAAAARGETQTRNKQSEEEEADAGDGLAGLVPSQRRAAVRREKREGAVRARRAHAGDGRDRGSRGRGEEADYEERLEDNVRWR
jgi:hypothetical protein